MHNWPKPNPPDSNYADTLQSYVLEPVKLALIEMFETSGYFGHCSCMFPFAVHVAFDKYFPHIQFHIPGGDVEDFTLKNDNLNMTVEIYYYAKHVKEQGYAAAEISHFIENGVYLIEKQRSFTIYVGEKEICVWLKGVNDVDIDYYVDGSFLISMGLITLTAVVPVCVLQPYDEDDEE